MSLNIQNNLFKDDLAELAKFSPCRKYRYTLWRRWNDGNNYVQFVGLNPSTADETKDDPTIRQCVHFAKMWGYDSMCMTNLFAFRATDPRIMKKSAFPVGDENDKWLQETAKDARIIIACWGIHGGFMFRDVIVKQMFGYRLFCLAKTAKNFPRHPLYLPKITTPIPFY